MKVVLLARPGVGTPCFDALQEGIISCGDSVEFVRMCFNGEDHLGGYGRVYGDVVVSWGIRHQPIVKRYGLRHLVMEMGFLGRNENYYMGFDGLNGRGFYPLYRIRAGEPWYHMVEPEWKVDHISDVRKVLVLGQIPSDSNLFEIGFEGYKCWVENTIEECERRGWEVEFRRHPRCQPSVSVCSLDTTTKTEGTLEDALSRNDMCVAYNSNSLVEAGMAGLPVVPASSQALAWEVRSSLDRVFRTSRWQRYSWIDHVASAQWNVEQMRSGEAWSTLKRHIIN